MTDSTTDDPRADDPRAAPGKALLSLCARRLLAHGPSARRALRLLPPQLYPVLFQAAFQDGRTLVLQDLVATWPFPLLSFRDLLGQRFPQERSHKSCIQAVISAVVELLRRELEDSFLACLEVAKHQSQHRERGSKRRKGPSSLSPAPLPVEIRADLFVNATSFPILREALGISPSSLLLLKCRDFHAEELPAAGTAALLGSLDPSGLRRVELRFNNLGMAGLGLILPQLSHFQDLLSLQLPYSNLDLRRPLPGLDAAIRCLAAHLGKLPRLKELNLDSSRLSGKLRQLFSDLESPLESLQLAFCSLLPSDLTFLSQSLHAPALRKLDLSGHHLNENLLQPLQLLLEEASASLLHLDLMECHLTDTRLEVLLPTLCRCSRLRCLGLFGNPLSTPGLQSLLRRTGVLRDLRLVVYPYPLECYIQDPTSGHPVEVDEERLAAVGAELSRMLGSSGRAGTLWTTSLCPHGALNYLTP
ncbi:PREDICTED: leucine-rich repeat-containing protein 14 [Chaetura pelagica]|uniref:leucine-rich repeat-containing protein 14 n=1 Tax=Chaetura pelagica TaxID=8897 RepID=UPI000523C589|nr:PREDICTED: leucine-rich repeat-containing protein 14 [Chaetura pelagica]